MAIWDVLQMTRKAAILARVSTPFLVVEWHSYAPASLRLPERGDLEGGHVSESTTPFRVCSKCKISYPATNEYFGYSKLGKHQTRSRCYSCLRAIAKQRYQDNHEQELERFAAFRAANPEKARAKVKASYYKHQSKRLESRKDYGKRNRAKEAEYSKAYNAKHPFWFKQCTALLRAKKLGVIIEPVNFGQIYKRDRGVCHVCGKKVTKRNLVFDHLTPMSIGGPHSEGNIKVAHYACNRDRKDDRPNR